ncbi:MAG: DUF4097 domain-containing protein [Microbacteriaceae bacterium]
MPTFPTPDPIDVSVEISYGRLTVAASDRGDSVVTVTPTRETSSADRRAAEQTRVELSGGRLVVQGPRPRFSIIGPNESIDIVIEVPSGSRLTADVGGRVTTTGRLGATRVKGSLGSIELDTVGDLWARAGHGNIEIGSATGSAELTADHGRMRIGAIGGDASLKSSHGEITVDEVGGDLEAKLSYGELEIGRARGGVTAKTAYGSIRLGEVSSGSVQVDSGYGQIDIGVAPGVAVWLDASSRDGRVRNQLEGAAAPGESDDSVAVRARTTYGDITITRSPKGQTS